MRNGLKPDQSSIDVGAEFVRLVELEQERDPGSFGSLQEVIDAANDHNQSMLDAMASVNPDMRAIVETMMRDGRKRFRWYDVVNQCFRGAEHYVEQLNKDSGRDPAE